MKINISFHIYSECAMDQFYIFSEVVSEINTQSRKFNTNSKTLTVHLSFENNNNSVDLRKIISEIDRTFQNLFVNILDGIEEDDEIRVSLRNEDLQREIFVPFRKKKFFSTDLLMNEIIKVSQSNENFLLNGFLELDIISVKVPHIGGKPNLSFLNINKWRKNSNKVVAVKGDGLCLARSIVISKGYSDGLRDKEWRRLREDTGKIQTTLAIDLCEKAGVSFDKTGVDYNDLNKFQLALGNEYQLIAVAPPKVFIFKGPFNEKQIFIQIIDNHSDSLLSIKAFLKCNYFCKKCLKGYMSLSSHKCVSTCRYCFSPGKCETIFKKDCLKCHRYFISEKCFENHISNKICNNYKYCKKCKKLYKDKIHDCGMKKCRLCKKIVPLSIHDCFVTPNNKSEIELQDSAPKIFVFYDFETFQEFNINNVKIHRPNHCNLEVVCDFCWDKILRDKKFKFCSFCSADKKCFTGYDTVKLFFDYIFTDLNNKMKCKRLTMKLTKPIKIKVIAHNARSYDLQFIIKYCYDNNHIPRNVVKRGTKILSMNLKEVQFIDSLSFLPMPLKSLPKTFGIENLNKGEFPHLYNKPENWFKILNHLPDIKYYQPETKKPVERAKFIEWYEKNKYNSFDFQFEIRKYCEMDVEILMRSLMIFRDIWFEYFKIDCLTRCITLPQAVMEVFKTNYLKPYQIAIIPRNGYDSRRKQSYISNAWLDFMQNNRENKILREYKIQAFVADGFIPETREVFEFYGCIFHGCCRCFQSNRFKQFNPFSGLTMDELYERTMKREKQLLDSNFKLTTIWECELNELRKSSESIDEYFKNHLKNFDSNKFTPNLEPRMAFFGGRVNASKLYHEVSKDEKIYYFDFTSLYPFVCKNKKFPIGHPKRITNFKDWSIDKYEGLVFCVVLPPQKLYFPVLPQKISNKLVFTLCYTCAFHKLYKCDHTENERSLTGVWVTEELKKALKFGYKIIRIFEVWHFENTSKLTENTHGLFDEFINDCIKGKIESSDWPKNDMTESEKQEYIDGYLKKENIVLDKNSIENNPGKRNTFKLIVNSFWGKFGQDSSKFKKTEFISSPEKFFQILSDDSCEVDDALLIGEEIIQVKYNKRTDYMEESNSSNVIIASYTTAYARLELYDLLSKLNERCLYFDTDSIIFTAKNDEYIPDTGLYLGELTNEVVSNDNHESFIAKFISCGPKNYCFEIFNPLKNESDFICKVKGLSLNFETNIIINFESMKKLIDEYLNELNINSLKVPQLKFTTNDFNEIETNYKFKDFQLVYDKRMLRNDYTTLPFGYKN